MIWLRKVVKKYDWFFYMLGDVLLLVGACIYIRLTGRGWWLLIGWLYLNLAIMGLIQNYFIDLERRNEYRKILDGRPWYK